MLLLRSISALIFSVFLLSACAGTSFISDAVNQEMGKIRVVTDKGRAEQLFRQEFERLSARHAISDEQYKLNTEISSSRGDNNMVMVVRYSLYDTEMGEVVTSHSFSSSASIGGVSSIFGEDQATVHASERLSKNLAIKVFNHLTLYFTRNLPSS